jgi:type I restriction enzyme M protein
MSERITQQQLESYLWGAATLLRGTIDAGDYKQFIFPLLFYKRLCDVFDEETQVALKESGGDKKFAAYPENHRFQIPLEAHWSVIRQTSSNVGLALQSATRTIETANPEKLYGIFGDAQWTNKDRLSDTMLRDLVEHFSSLELTLSNLPEDELGQGYEYLIKKFADDSGHTAAEFYTNRTVVHLMTELLEPEPGESIYDPTCGSGGMLLSCITHLRRQGNEWRNVRLFGQERNLMTSSIARMNCFLHGIEDFQIVRGDTLAEPKFVEGDRLKKFDVVLANPPYSIKQWDREAFASDPWGRNLYGTPPQGRADYAFWQHILCSLSPKKGRCAILFPHGVLFRQEESEMRRKLIEADLIECVIGLGPNLFYNSPMEACIVVCRSPKPKTRKGRILFINAVNEVMRERAQSFLADEHIDRIISAYSKFRNQEGFGYVAPLQEVRGKQGNLSIPLYISSNGTSETEKVSSIHSVQKSLFAWLSESTGLHESLNNVFTEKGSLLEIKREFGGVTALPRWVDRSLWMCLPFSEFAENINDRVEPTEAADELYVGLDDLDPGSLHISRTGKGSDVIGTKLRFRKGDIIFARRRAYQRKVASAETEGICSAHAMVVRAKPEKALPEFLPFFMMSNQFLNRAIEISVGSLSPTINWRTLRVETFNLPPLDQQRRLAEIFWALDSCIERVRRLMCLVTKAQSSVFGTKSWSHASGQPPLVLLEQVVTRFIDYRGKTPKKADQGIPLITAKNVRAGFLSDDPREFIPEKDFAKWMRRGIPSANDVLFTTEAPLGNVARVPDYRFALAQRIICLVPDIEKIDSAFLFWGLQSPDVQRRILQTASGTTVLGIKQSNLRKVLFPLPHLQVQREMADLCDRLETARQRVESLINSLKTFRSALLDEVFNSVSLIVT